MTPISDVLPHGPLQPPYATGRQGPQYTGFLVVAVYQKLVDLLDPARYQSYATLDSLLLDADYDPQDFNAQADELATKLVEKNILSRRLVTSLTASEIKDLLEVLSQDALADVDLRSPGPAAFWRLDVRGRDDAAALVDWLKGYNKVVELAYRERLTTEPLNPTDDPLSPRQSYLDAAPVGIDARWAWSQGIDGAPYGTRGFQLLDLEQGWILDHEELLQRNLEPLYNDNRHNTIVEGPPRRVYLGHHGTAVLGVVAGIDNAVGIVGTAPAAIVSVISHYQASDNTSFHVANAIYRALKVQDPLAKRGDILLIEVQRDELPTESDEADFRAITAAVQFGIIVVEAAGNGRTELEAWRAPDADAVGPFPLRRESGAILVGAACPTLPHNRWRPSNFGSRVVCYGWGAGVVSAGYGDLNFNGTPLQRRYTARFGGTSSAAAMIAGAALLVQSAASKDQGPLLGPTAMRDRLRDRTTGTPQGPGVPGSIGVMPDLRAVVRRLLQDRGGSSSNGT